MSAPTKPPSPGSFALLPAWVSEDQAPWLAGLALLAATLLATLRAALLISVSQRILLPIPPGRKHDRLVQLLGRSDSLATSASLLTKGAQVLFVVLAIQALGTQPRAGETARVLGIAAGVAGLVLSGEVLPPALARALGDRMLRRCLPCFHILQLPLEPVRRLVEALRAAALRVLRVPDEESAARRLVAGLRGALTDAAPNRELDEQEREMIENVIEFRRVDALEVMTPRTEVHAVALAAGVEGALDLAIERGLSRLPVYRDTIDNIIGTALALDLARARQAGQSGPEALRAVLRPPFMIPETKLLAELLNEFRQRQEKMAIVVDEYGGTAGLVTVTDVLRELVGEIPEADAGVEEVKRIDAQSWEVPATLHVTEVNEALGVLLPEEEDFETLAGFVLARLGRLPAVGESFDEAGISFRVLEASDRRVLRVLVRRGA